MPDMLKNVDNWFLILGFASLSYYFAWSVKRWIDGLTQAIQELKETIRRLFEDRNSHAQEIAAIKARCEAFREQGVCK